MATWKWVAVVLTATLPIAACWLFAELSDRRERRPRWKDSGDDRRRGFIRGRW